MTNALKIQVFKLCKEQLMTVWVLCSKQQENDQQLKQWDPKQQLLNPVWDAPKTLSVDDNTAE